MDDILGDIYVPSKYPQNTFTLVCWDVCSVGCPVSQSESVSGSFMGFYGFSGWETHGNWNLQLLMWSVVINNKEDSSGLEKYNLNEASVLRDSV